VAHWLENEWFYMNGDEKKRGKLMTMVMSPLSLNFGMTRPLCNMQLGSPCQLAEVEFRVAAEQISTRDLVQEYLANRTYPTSSGWGMPKMKETKKKHELVRLPYRFKFEKQFKEPCQEWLDMIETMCNEILGNYTKKEDQLMIAALGTRPKRRLNRVMDALKFEYPDYERLDKGAEGVKRKRVVSILSRQAARMVKEDEKASKKRKVTPEPKAAAAKKWKAESPEPKITEVVEETPSMPPAAAITEILKVMTESLPVELLNPLGPELMKLLQKKDEPLATKKKADVQKKRRIVTVMQAIKRTPPSASASKITPVASAEAVAEAKTSAKAAAATEVANLESILSGIDKMLLNMATEEIAVAAEKAMATVPGKGKKIADTASEEMDFDLRNLVGQELSEAEKKELQEYGISYGYQPGPMLFGGIDEGALGCIRDRAGAKIIDTLSKSVGFLKLEADISGYQRQHIVDSLFYSNFKVKLLLLSFF
jgi:hypothetical protein